MWNNFFRLLLVKKIIISENEEKNFYWIYNKNLKYIFFKSVYVYKVSSKSVNI